jgi:hypothetical protein
MTSSKREPATLSGVIVGQGEQASCTVSAIKVTGPGGVVAYARHKVERVSKALPAGDYQLTVNGETTHIRYDGEHWLSRGY